MRYFNRRAGWIWRRRGLAAAPFAAAPRIAEEANYYVYFRRVIEIADPIQEANVHVSADGRYQLFVNGRFVGRGPARCTPSWQYVDPYDLAPYLCPGRNVLAALAHAYGRPTAWYEPPQWEQARAFGCGGFFLQGDVVTSGGARICLDTGPAWRYLVADAWQRDAPCGSLGWIEIYDARRVPMGWAAVDFDDSGWEAAEVLRVPGRNTNADVIPFPVLVPRAIPPLREAVRQPQAVLRCGEVINAPEAPDIAALLAQEPISDIAACRVRDVEALLTEDGAAEIATAGERSVAIVVDFGQTIAGYVRLDLDGPAGAVVDFACDERLEPDGRVRLPTGIPGFDVRHAHRYILREGRQVWERFEWNGFRYLQATFRRCARPLRVHALCANTTGYPVQARGQFACSDDLLNRIWQAGAATLRLCMHDAYIDCPSREQRQWIGDAYVQALANYAAFGDPLLAAQMLRQTAQSQRADGLTMMATPGDFAVADFTNIPDFCLYWILAIGRYIDYIGDTAIVDELYPSVVKAIGWFERHLDADDLLADVPHWVFIDWADLDKAGQVTALNAQFVASLRVAARLAQAAGSGRDAARFAALAERVAAAINRHLWDDERGVYVDARHNGRRSRRVSQQANAATIAFDVAPAARWPRIFAAILDEARLVLTHPWASDTARPAFDDERNIVLAQPFYAHHLHRALSKAGLYPALLDSIRRRWGSMLAAGDATFWETWQLEPLSSKAHAWAATPTYDLSTEVLGIAPTAPGFRCFRLAPQPVDLAWARGAFPTPHGEIQVTWQRAGSQFELVIDMPEGTRAEVVLPGSASRIEVDGRPTPANDIMLGAGPHQIIAWSRECPSNAQP